MTLVFLKKYFFSSLILAFLSFVVFFSYPVSAQAKPYTLIVPFPGQNPQVSSPQDYIKALYTFGLGFGALLAMVMIVIGAVQYTASEAITSKEDAKDRIQKAILGLILLIVATVILYTINPALPDLTEPTLQQTQ